MLEAASEPLLLLFIDWATAFDAVKVESIMTVLYWTGVPEHYQHMIRGIYTDNTFAILGNGSVLSLVLKESGYQIVGLHSSVQSLHPRDGQSRGRKAACSRGSQGARGSCGDDKQRRRQSHHGFHHGAWGWK